MFRQMIAAFASVVWKQRAKQKRSKNEFQNIFCHQRCSKHLIVSEYKEMSTDIR